MDSGAFTTTSTATFRCQTLQLQFYDMMMARKLLKGYDGIAVKDKLSTLPDVVLADILSRLPTKDAVATTILSHRWRRVYTLIKRLDFEFPDSHISDRVHLFHIFELFVDNVLQACQSENTSISSFRLQSGNSMWSHREQGCCPEIEPMHFNSWILFPLIRGVRELDICFHARNPDKLPSAVFHCQTLEVLKLNVNFDLEVPLHFSLPFLKELNLALHSFPNDFSMARLVSSCPSLEHLAVKGDLKFENPIHISSQSLRSLAMIFSLWDECQRSMLVLDVPNLERLEYDDNLALRYSIGNLNSLAEAEVDTMCVYTEDSQLQNIYSFLSSLSNVRSLFLMKGCVETLCLCEIREKLPVFRNLKHLQLGCFGYIEWNKVVMDLLNCAPFLEKLAFPEGIVFDAGHNDEGRYVELANKERQLWSRTQTIPPCLRFHLKSISIEDYERTLWELEMVKFFLRSSFAFSELVIVCKIPVTVADKELLEVTLQKLPRSSVSCSVVVQ